MRLVRCPPPRRPQMRARGRGAINAGGRGRWRPEDDWPSMCFPAETLWLAALAGLKHPFPSRTRPLRAPAAMILRSGARESSALPTSFSQPRATRSRGAFSCAWRARGGAGAARHSGWGRPCARAARTRWRYARFSGLAHLHRSSFVLKARSFRARVLLLGVASTKVRGTRQRLF